MTTLISKTNVRYITGSSKKSEGKIVSIKFRVFAETKEILDSVTKLMNVKKTGLGGKVDVVKYNGWDLKKNKFFTEFITKNRAEFQESFKTAKKAAISASRKALEISDDSKRISEIAKDIVNS